MDLELKDKVAVVTGGSRGIGKAISWSLAQEGARVAVVARDVSALDATAAEITRATGSAVKAFQADTGSDAAVKAMVQGVLAAFFRIDILVNCAATAGGQTRAPKLAEMTDEAFWAEMNIKVMGYVRTAREIAPLMAKQGGGRMINISGLAARSAGSIIGTIRNISVAALTKNLADELGPQGISVVCVHPATTRTEKTEDTFARQAKAQGVSTDEIEKRMAARNLIGRLITAEEIGHVVAFLASPKSIAINGDVIATGGGTPGAIYY